MKDTCRGKDCYWWQLTDGECPDYVETAWTPANGGQPVIVKDCVKQRIFLMLAEMQSRLVAVERSNEEQRNQSFSVLATLTASVQTALEKQKQLEFYRPTKQLPVVEGEYE